MFSKPFPDEFIEDDEQDRSVWMCQACPLKEECSDGAWKRANCWSYISEGHVCLYIKHHLLESGKHHLVGCTTSSPDQEAAAMAGDAIIKESVETFADREAYRKSVEKQRSARVVSPPPRGTKRPRDREPCTLRPRSQRRERRGQSDQQAQPPQYPGLDEFDKAGEAGEEGGGGGGSTASREAKPAAGEKNSLEVAVYKSKKQILGWLKRTE